MFVLPFIINNQHYIISSLDPRRNASINSRHHGYKSNLLVIHTYRLLSSHKWKELVLLHNDYHRTSINLKIALPAYIPPSYDESTWPSLGLVKLKLENRDQTWIVCYLINPNSSLISNWAKLEPILSGLIAFINLKSIKACIKFELRLVQA